MIAGVTNSGSVTMIVDPERDRSDDVLAVIVDPISTGGVPVIVVAAERERENVSEGDTSVSGISGVTVRDSRATMDTEEAALSS